MSEAQAYLATAREAVLKAGAYARAHVGRWRSIEYKGETDPVTEVDRYNEDLMVRLIGGRYPDHDIVGEEGTDTGGSSGYRWYIDPLDGTVNFAHGMPWFSVSAAMLIDGVTEAGAIYCPMNDELFTATRGGGAFLDDEPIHVSAVADVKRSLLGTGFPYDVASRLDAILAPLRIMLAASQGVRRGGSACMDLCQVACGRFDGFWELGLHTWDVAAGFLIVREAGGKVSNFDGDEGSLIVERVVASNSLLHPSLLALLGSANSV